MSFTRIKLFARRYYTHIPTGIFFLTIMVLFTFPIKEGDYFWHVKTGEWIWEHKSFPISDPFSSISRFLNPTEHVVERTQFLLKQYWLGQLALFGVWKAVGEAGMVVLRTVIYTGILGFMYWWLRRDRNGITPLATVFVVGNVLSIYPNERPQIFAYLFMVFMLYLLERLTGRDNNFLKLHAALLLLVMLAWSNCHGSFILGIVVIALYMAGHLLTGLLKGGDLNRPLLVVLTGAILITLVNPNGFAAFKAIRDVDKTYMSNIVEYASPLRLALDQHVFLYGFWFLMAAAIIALILSFRSMALHHIAVIISLAALSLTAVRYIPFFVLAAPLVAIYLPNWKPTGKYRLLSLLILLVWLSVTDFQNVFKFRSARTFPKEAVRFLNTVRPPGNIFNDEFWGGYLMCYTDYPVFVDGRGLVENFNNISSLAFAGINWKGPFSFFNINVIIMPGCDQDSKKTYPLLLQLQQDDDWSFVYQDDVAVIFVRNIPQNRDLIARHQIPKDQIYNHLVRRWAWLYANEL